ncbi:MAG: MFS transporter DHA1 family multidrug resistance protein [Ignavibacteria bacterium]|nr:MAG: MFS transporter DHA1 family multidrug resistance protein [Ignavibacteria bacterium]KAF0159124.1 MAG: MFS transporter DHA1 family multidrug resistance protein [Ignavibacteria bacterium]
MECGNQKVNFGTNNKADMHSENYWKKNLYALFISQFFYRAGTRSIIPFLPLYVKELSGENFEIAAIWSGWIFAAPFLISFITTPLLGSVGDKYGRKLIVLIAIFGFAISNILMSFSSSLLFLLIAASTQELFGGAYPAAVSLTAANSPKEKTTEALSYLQLANALGNIIGPVLGGVLADTIGYKNVFLITAVSVSLTSLPIFFFVKESNIEKRTNYHSLLDNLKYFTAKHGLIVCGVMLLGFTLSLTMMRPNFTFFVQQQFAYVNNVATTAGILFSLFGAAAAVSVALLPFVVRKIERWIILTASYFISSISFFLLITISNIYLFAAIFFVLGFVLGVVLPLVYSLTSDYTTQDRKSGVMGIGSSFQMTGNLLGPLSAGYIASIFGAHFSFLLSGTVLAAAILFYKIMEKDVKASN